MRNVYYLSNPKVSMAYVDGFVIALPKKNLKAYRKMAAQGMRVWMKHGAVAYAECMGDDLKNFPGTMSFKKLAKLKTGEVPMFSYIVFKNKAHRNAVNKKVMAELMKGKAPAKMPFDMKRMAYAGFKSIAYRSK